MHRRLRLIIGAPHFTSLALFRLKLHGGLKTVDVDPQCPVEFGELVIGQLAREEIIANHLPNDLPVLLFHVALIVASSRTPSCESEPLLFTKRKPLNVQMVMSLQLLHQRGQEGNEPLRTDVVGRHPCQVQGLLYFQAVGGCPWTLDGHLGRHRMAQQADSILACVAGGRDELIEDDRFQGR